MSKEKKTLVNMLGNGDHHINYPVFKRVTIIDENGDAHDEWRELSDDEKKNPRQMSEFTNLGNGFLVPDVSHFDRFQAMDMLESYIDNLPKDMFGKQVEQPAIVEQ